MYNVHPFKLLKLGNGFNGRTEEESNETGDLAKIRENIPHVWNVFRVHEETRSRERLEKRVSFQGQMSLAREQRREVP